MILRPTALIVTLALGFLAAPLAADEQPPAKVPRVGYLGNVPASAAPYLEAFRQGLRERGYIEGQNLTIEYRWAEEQYERYPDLAAELVRLEVAVIVTFADPAIHAAKNATDTMPIVFISASDPVGTKLVASLAKPGGNIPGVAFEEGPGQAAKRLQLFKEAVPKVSRVAILRDADDPAEAGYEREARVAARGLGMTLHFVRVRGPADFQNAFAAILRERAEALSVGGLIAFRHRSMVLDFAEKNRLPTYSSAREYGTLLSYAPSVIDQYRRAATYVAKILKGAKPADLPVEQPTKYELVVNLKTARVLGLTIPQSILIQADEVIQ